MHERIKEVRKKLHLTQEEFAGRLGIKRAAISNYEIGRNEPIDAVISLICREFSINEDWLRNGKGEMFTETAQEDRIFAFMGDVMHGDPDFRRHLISVLSRMTPEEWTLMEKKAWELVEEMKKAGPSGPAE